MKNFFIVIFVLLSFVQCKAQTPEELAAQNKEIDSTKVILPDEQHVKINQIITRLLSRYHYRRAELNDSLSQEIYDQYINVLDNNKLYFLKKDVESFEKYRNEFDTYLLTGELEPAYDIFNVFKTRLNERIKYVDNQLKSEFDFTLAETYTPDRDEAEWAKSIEELNEIWRKRVKNDALNLKLAGKEWDKIVETLENRYHRFHKVILQYNTEDVFQIYMNAFGYVVDPHTSYFSPITSENFQIDMSLSLEGIGAQLTSDNDYTKVAQIIAGGPAEKSEQLFEDDRIVGVGQGDDGELIDVIGWRLDDVVQLIRGKKGTTVRLSVLRPEMTPDMQPDLIKIVRDKVKLEERAAKSDILDIEQDEYNFKLGLIDLPSFYIDFDAQRKGETDYKSTTRDVKKLISDLKKENIDGLIIDLRNNGGGSLQEAIDLTGLFIETGPVVQVRNTDGSIEVGEDSNPSVVYDGPLAVIVNRYSASASEIFSGAIQDYGRGIVIGEQTFGKGTVQNLINLKRLVPSTKNKLGELKLTVAKYYRINGSSTQHKGVVPDITFPTVLGSHEYGESSRTSALPWDTIRSSNFKRISDIDEFIPELLKRHNERMKKSIEYEFRLEDIEEYKEARNRKEFSLNEDIRKTERDEREKRKEARDEERQKLAELKLKEKGEVGTTESKIDDFELEESARILADLILQGYS